MGLNVNLGVAVGENARARGVGRQPLARVADGRLLKQHGLAIIGFRPFAAFFQIGEADMHGAGHDHHAREGALVLVDMDLANLRQFTEIARLVMRIDFSIGTPVAT